MTAVVREVTATGDAIAKLEDGRCVLVGGVVQGERIELELPAKGGTMPRARLRGVLEPSEVRVAPPCPLVDRCGGCDWMHLSDEARGQLHLRHAAELVGRATGQSGWPDIPIHRPCDPLGYRTRARLVLSAKGSQVRVGYRRGKSHRLVAVDHCPVLCETLAAAPAEIARWLEGSEGEGEVQVALGEAGRWVLDLHFVGQLDAAVFATADRQVRGGAWAGVSIWCDGATVPATFGDPRAVIADLDGAPLTVAPGGFAQASDRGAVQLAMRLRELIQLAPGGRIVELFAGSGTLSVVLAPLADHYLAIEQSGPAAEQLRANLKARGIQAKVQVGDANQFVVPRPTATVVLDPPRTGAREAVQRLVTARPRQVVYVSCNLATLARDLAVLTEAGYQVEQLELFELFPQTSHVETVVRLVRDSDRRSGGAQDGPQRPTPD